jgi:hypothetical protein
MSGKFIAVVMFGRSVRIRPSCFSGTIYLQLGAFDGQLGVGKVGFGSVDNRFGTGRWIMDEDKLAGPGFRGDSGGVLRGGMEDALSGGQIRVGC